MSVGTPTRIVVKKGKSFTFPEAPSPHAHTLSVLPLTQKRKQVKGLRLRNGQNPLYGV
jgi:hypothetical protein